MTHSWGINFYHTAVTGQCYLNIVIPTFSSTFKMSICSTMTRFLAKNYRMYSSNIASVLTCTMYKVLIACSSPKTKTKTKTKAFVRSCMFWKKPVTNELIILFYVLLRAWFVRQRHYLERTKTFILGFVFFFVLAHEQAISTSTHPIYYV